jgi:ABC-2 type transport system ATP-binding protein
MSAAAAPAAIEASGLTRTFGDFIAVDDVSLRVEAGSIFAFLGANGSGKTTTIRMLIGLLRPTRGSIRVAGIDVVARPRRVREAIGYMGQKVSLYQGLTLRENVQFYAGLHGLEGSALGRRWAALRERFSLAQAEGSRAEDLPAGLRQRAGLALAMLHEPNVLFLDEPTAGVDLASRALFWDLIREQKRAGTTIFVTTHFLDEADHCDFVAFLDEGRLVAEATPEGLRERWTDGYRAFCPAAPDQAETRSRLLGDAGWSVAAAPDGLALHSPRATTAMLAALRQAAGPEEAPLVRIEQPAIAEAFHRLMREARGRKESRP